MLFPVRSFVPTSLILLAALAVVLVSHQPRADAAAVLRGHEDGRHRRWHLQIADCSLREAIIAANADRRRGHDHPAGGHLPVHARRWLGERSAAGDLDITDDVTINGGGAATTIVDAGDLDRVLSVFSGTANVSGVTIAERHRRLRRRRLCAAGALNLTNVTVSGNTAYGFAAGINNTGT